MAEVVGMPMKTSTTSNRLAEGIAQCAAARRDTYNTGPGYHHRDVNEGNISLYPEGTTVGGDDTSGSACKAVPTDWDMEKRTGEQSDPTRQTERTGAWPFVSIGSFRRGWKNITVEDDMESIFYLLLYTAVHFLSSSERDVPRFVHEFFDSYNLADEEECGGCSRKKWVSMTLQGSIFTKDCLLVFLRDQALAHVLADAPDRFEVTQALTWEPPFPASVVPPPSILPYLSPCSIYKAAVQSDNAEVQQGPSHLAPARVWGHPINEILTPLFDSITARLSLSDDSSLARAYKRTPEVQESFETRAALIRSHEGVLDLFNTVLYGDRTASQPKWPENDKIRAGCRFPDRLLASST